jgi:hypothetical protein
MKSILQMDQPKKNISKKLKKQNNVIAMDKNENNRAVLSDDNNVSLNRIKVCGLQKFILRTKNENQPVLHKNRK